MSYLVVKMVEGRGGEVDYSRLQRDGGANGREGLQSRVALLVADRRRDGSKFYDRTDKIE
ncbi:hypothetical protein [Methylosinus trichosporium]|uniref:hypothetical protein n=1 Tax=Methylosinus trichosporium TaxID=426 RepID=UPI0013000B59|nr:hypothetical protein [Methylosinus trichosporium]